MKSLKFVLLITAIALVPLGLGVMVLKQSEQAQLEQDAALESEANAAAARLRDSIAETRATVLITAHNFDPAIVEVFCDVRAYERAEAQRSVIR